VIRGEEVKKERQALSSLGVGAGSATRSSGEKEAEATSEEYVGLESNAEVRGEGREYVNDSEHEDESEAPHPEQIDTATATATDVGIPVGIPVEVEIDSDGSSLSEDAIHMRVRLNAENTARRQDLAVTRAAARAAAATAEEAHPSIFSAKVTRSYTLVPYLKLMGYIQHDEASVCGMDTILLSAHLSGPPSPPPPSSSLRTYPVLPSGCGCESGRHTNS
jgi:hypothetical protein